MTEGRNRGVAAGLCVVVALLLVGLWVLRGSGESPPDAPVAQVADRHGGGPVQVGVAAADRPAPSGECAFRVRVEQVDGGPAAGMPVRVHLDPRDRREAVETNAASEVDFAGVACGSEGTAFAEAPSFIGTYASATAAQILAGERVLLTLDPGMRVYGVVHDPDGRPLAGANVNASYPPVSTGPDGTYEQQFLPGRDDRIAVTLEGYGRAGIDIPLPTDRDAEEVRLDIDLQPERQVRVTCEGIGDPGCATLQAMRCHPPGVVMAPSWCEVITDRETYTAQHQRCTCPPGAAVVSASGESVTVVPDATDAVLRFDGHTITGRIVVDGQPSFAMPRLHREPRTPAEAFGSSSVTGHRMAGMDLHAKRDGTIRFEGVQDGVWRIHAGVSIDDDIEEVVLATVTVAGRDIDLGTLEARSGGSIVGRVAVPEGEEYGPMVEVRPAAGGPARFAMPGEGAGDFRAYGLEPGAWTVSLQNDPDAAVTVTVEEGVVTDGVELPFSARVVLPRSGFAFEELDGEVVVSDVDPDGPAARAGLAVGDVVRDATFADLEVEAHPGMEPEDWPAHVASIVGMWDGPGVTLRLGPTGDREVTLDF